MRLEPATTGVIGRGAKNYTTKMSKMIPNLANIWSRSNPDQTDSHSGLIK